MRHHCVHDVSIAAAWNPEAKCFNFLTFSSMFSLSSNFFHLIDFCWPYHTLAWLLLIIPSISSKIARKSYVIIVRHHNLKLTLWLILKVHVIIKKFTLSNWMSPFLLLLINTLIPYFNQSTQLVFLLTYIHSLRQGNHTVNVQNH